MQDVKALADTKPNDKALTSAPLHPAIAQLVLRVAKIYACQGMINYYAARVGLSNDIVDEPPEQKAHDDIFVRRFTNTFYNKFGKDVCGSIRFEVPLGLPGYDAKTRLGSWMNRVARPFNGNGASAVQDAAYRAFAKDTLDLFIGTETLIHSMVDNIIQRYLPHGVYLPAPSAENLIETTFEFQRKLATNLKELSQQKKWSQAEVESFVGVAQCAAILPTATGPDEEIFANYRSAFADYTRFKTLLDEAIAQ